MSRKPTVTGPQRIEREQRIAEILALRVAGNSLQAIADAQDPPVTAQAIHKTIKQAIERMADEAVEQIRRIESLRLDEAMLSIYSAASAGDLVAIDRMLDIMRRRSRLMGLDTPVRWAPGAGDEFTPSQVSIEIVGGPDPEHVRRLEAVLEGRDRPRTTSLN